MFFTEICRQLRRMAFSSFVSGWIVIAVCPESDWVAKFTSISTSWWATVNSALDSVEGAASSSSIEAMLARGSYLVTRCSSCGRAFISSNREFARPGVTVPSCVYLWLRVRRKDALWLSGYRTWNWAERELYCHCPRIIVEFYDFVRRQGFAFVLHERVGSW